MSSRFFCVASLIATTLLSTSCSKNERQGRSDTEESSPSSPPNISPTAAPGVAFNFGYEFSLPDNRIAATQEAHAAACERLGLQRCRITGMSYTVDQSEQVTAELDLKLDPLIARQFGKAAQRTVEGNDGKLVRLEIGSSDEGQTIANASQQKSEATAQIEQLKRVLEKAKPGSPARANLMTQIQALQQQASERSRTIEASQAALASTPLRMNYYGHGGAPGFRGNPVREAWHTFVGTIVSLVSIVLQALAVIVPLSLLLAAFIALWRTRPVRAVRRWLAGSREAEVEA